MVFFGWLLDTFYENLYITEADDTPFFIPFRIAHFSPMFQCTFTECFIYDPRVPFSRCLLINNVS